MCNRHAVSKACVHGIAGGDFSPHSRDKGDLIMIKLGVRFISEVGDILYQAFTSDVLKEDLAKSKGVEVEVTNQVRCSLWLTSVFYPFAIAVHDLALNQCYRC